MHYEDNKSLLSVFELHAIDIARWSILRGTDFSTILNQLHTASSILHD